MLTCAGYALMQRGLVQVYMLFWVQQCADTPVLPIKTPLNLNLILRHRLWCWCGCVQSSQFLIPYPEQGRYQLGIAWWIIQFELFIFLWSAAATVFTSLRNRLRRVALSFLPAGLVIVVYVIDAVLYLSRDDTAKLVYGATGLNLTLVSTKTNAPTACRSSLLCVHTALACLQLVKNVPSQC